MYELYQDMLILAEKMGDVIESHMYPSGYISITVHTPDGKVANLSHSIEKVAKENAE